MTTTTHPHANQPAQDAANQASNPETSIQIDFGPPSQPQNPSPALTPTASQPQASQQTDVSFQSQTGGQPRAHLSSNQLAGQHGYRSENALQDAAAQFAVQREFQGAAPGVRAQGNEQAPERSTLQSFESSEHARSLPAVDSRNPHAAALDRGFESHGAGPSTSQYPQGALWLLTNQDLLRQAALISGLSLKEMTP